jgi:hypothetical protein
MSALDQRSRSRLAPEVRAQKSSLVPDAGTRFRQSISVFAKGAKNVKREFSQDNPRIPDSPVT